MKLLRVMLMVCFVLIFAAQALAAAHYTFGGQGATILQIQMDSTGVTGVQVQSVANSTTYWKFFESSLTDSVTSRIMAILLTAKSADAPVGLFINASGKVVGASLVP